MAKMDITYSRQVKKYMYKYDVTSHFASKPQCFKMLFGERKYQDVSKIMHSNS